MAISIDPITKEIFIPQADLTFVSGALYELDTEAFRLAMNALMDDPEYIWLDDYAIRNAPVTVAGTTFAQTIELINGWNITFENLTMTVRLSGSNNNLFDVENGILNPSGNVTVIGQNSAGLVLSGGSGLSPAESTKLTELHQFRGLDVDNNLEITDTAQTVAGKTVVVSDDGTTTTVNRS